MYITKTTQVINSYKVLTLCGQCLFFGVNVKKSPLLLASKPNWLTI